MNPIRKLLICFCLPTILLAASTALADSDHDTARQLLDAGDILSLETILQKLRVSHPGKILEVELENKHGQLLYEIELLDKQGKVWKLKVNPRNGELLQRKEEH